MVQIIRRTIKVRIRQPKIKEAKVKREKKPRKKEIIGLQGLVNDQAVDRQLRDAARESLNFPTEEQERKGLFIEKLTKDGKRRAHNLAECNLDVYLHRRSITREQHAAGIKLFTDFSMSGLISGMKSCLNVSLVRSSGGKTFMNFAVYENFRAAVEAIRPCYRKITVIACAHGENLKDIKTSIPLYRRMDALQRGLDDLAEHYSNALNPKRIMESFNASLTTTMGPPVALGEIPKFLKSAANIEDEPRR